MAQQVYGDSGQGSDNGWSKGDIVQLVALLVGIPAVIGAVIACSGYFKRRCLTDEESSDENREAETVEQTGRAQDATHEGAGDTTSRGGIQAASRSLIATVVPTRSETHGPEEGAYPRRVYAWPQTFGLQDNDPRSSWSTYEPPTGRSNQSMPSAPSIPAPVSFPALHTRIHMRGEYTIAGVAEDSERVRNFAIWLQREYERTNLQIMGERDAWVSELRGSAGLRSRSSLVGEYREPNSIAAM